MKSIKVFSPASVSNVCCGFDVLGFAISGLGDIITVSSHNGSGIHLGNVTGYSIPNDLKYNTASVAAQSMLDFLNIKDGFIIDIEKNIKPGSGIGSSAASSVGAVYALNKILGEPLKKEQLIKFAMQGELISSKSAPADNVASALYGGLVLVNNFDNYRVTNLPAPNDIYAVIHHPLLEMKTSESRSNLPKKVDLKTTSNQLSYIAEFVHSLNNEDYELMGKSLKDCLVEHCRVDSIPIFNQAKRISLENSSLCYSISGSGPSCFSLIKEKTKAVNLKNIIDKLFVESKVKFNSYLTPLSSPGVHEIK